MIGTALRLRSTKVAVAVAGIAGLAMCQVPLLGVHGLESALLLGVVLPPFAAVIGARLVVACRRQRCGADAMNMLRGALIAAAVVLAVPALILAFNAFRVRNCAPLQGLLFILLGPGMAMALAAVAGLAVALAIKPARVATALAALLPLASVGVALYHLYTTPAVFAYSHFFGFFHGSFYDEAVGVPNPLLTLRLVTTVMIAGLVALLCGFHDSEQQRLCLRPGRPGWLGWTLIFILSLFCALYAELFGTELGHRTTSAWIAHKLDARVRGKHCTVVLPRETPRDQAERMAADCDFRVQQMQRWFGVKQRRRVTAFFFRSADEKRQLMGAARTNIAKPWRNEVYLRLGAWPHPVLAHEIAHLVAANTASGPFKIAGRFNGLWPNPALIEGTAVAAAWNAHNGMTPHQWARSMIETGLAPGLKEVLGAGFLAQPKQQAYVIAGSFVRHVAERYGAAKVRRIYATGDVSAVLQKSSDDLEQRWHARVMTIPLPRAAHGLARVRFAAKSILSSVCPHTVAGLRDRLRADLSAANHDRAAESCREILQIDPTDASTRAALVAALAQSGRLNAARKQLQELLAPPRAAAPVIAAARQAMADTQWRSGKPSAARAIYRSLLKQPLSEDAIRLLQVKSIALQQGSEQARLLFELLVGSDNATMDGAFAVHLARELRAHRDDGLPFYLEARQLFFRQRFDPAAELMQEALEAGLPSEQLRVEATRLQGMAQYALGKLDASERLWQSLSSKADPALTVEARDWLDRISYARNGSL